jgi:hypothetical protein
MKEPTSISGWPIKPDSCQVDLRGVHQHGLETVNPVDPCHENVPEGDP